MMLCLPSSVDSLLLRAHVPSTPPRLLETFSLGLCAKSDHQQQKQQRDRRGLNSTQSGGDSLADDPEDDLEDDPECLRPGRRWPSAAAV